MGLGPATALNMIDMIGVGPFITMPLVLSAMGGPQALLGWILGALLAVCDGLVSAELGAALPASGKSRSAPRFRLPRDASVWWAIRRTTGQN
jgi:amino acid transporter